MDRSVQELAQEGSGRGSSEKTYPPKPEVPTCHRWCFPHRHHGQEKHEARGPQGTERTGNQSCQGEGKDRQGWRCTQGWPHCIKARGSKVWQDWRKETCRLWKGQVCAQERQGLEGRCAC